MSGVLVNLIRINLLCVDLLRKKCAGAGAPAKEWHLPALQANRFNASRRLAIDDTEEIIDIDSFILRDSKGFL